jgi:SAM-dependent methyltransferase
MRERRAPHRLLGIVGVVLLSALPARAQDGGKPIVEPDIGQAGKDVIWVPTPPELVEKMMDLAQVTTQDFVVDLGSGDGRNVIAAAKRGARALGVEFDDNLVAVSRRNAAAAGVGDKAQFVQNDMFKADFSKATVLALFLLPSNMLQLRSKFLELAPGSRIVSNTFMIADWQADAQDSLVACDAWCTAYLWIVPGKASGTWQLGSRELTLTQSYQMLSGALSGDGGKAPVEGRLRGNDLRFSAGNTEYVGRISGNRMEGTATTAGTTSPFSAARK